MIDSDLYFVRHGQTDWSAQGRFQGRSDTALNAVGSEQADQLAVKLNAALSTHGAPGDRPKIITSPLLRARQTAERIALGLGYDPDMIVSDAALIELSFGQWEGLDTAQIKQSDNENRRARKADRWSIAPPGGESYAERAGGIGAWIRARTGPAILVTHSGIMRIICHLVAQVPVEQAAITAIPHDRILHVKGQTLQWL